jgi:peptidoglycan/xylan/chitin deacetylase (PgdA/CDA1 family)
MKATLTYHSIDDSGSPISVPPSIFDTHLRWLTSGRVRALSLDGLTSHPHDGPDAVAVTFDDGFLNIREPVERLLDAGVPVTIFVVSRHVGGTNAWRGVPQAGIPTLPLLAWDDLEQLVARGASIGAHTRTHARLTQLDPAAQDDELLGAEEDLRGRLGVSCEHLAYPYGDVDDAVAARAAARYRFGHTTRFAPLGSDDPRLLLPRLDMYYFRRQGTIDAWGSRRFQQRLVMIRWRRALRALVTRRPAAEIPA